MKSFFYMISSAIFRRLAFASRSLSSEQVHEAGSEGSNQKNLSIHHRTGGSIAIIRRAAPNFTLDVGFAAVS